MLSVKNVNINGQIEGCKSVNLIIGSNNSGKSTLLHELIDVISGLQNGDGLKWIKGATLQISNPKESVQKLFPDVQFDGINDYRQLQGNNFIDSSGFSIHRPNIAQSIDFYINMDFISNYRSLSDNTNIEFELENPNDQLSMRDNYWLFHLMTATNVADEFCDSRLQADLSANISNYLSAQNGSSIIQHLLSNPKQLKQIQDNIKSVFKVYIGFDNLQQGEKPLRILPASRIRNTQNRRKDAEDWAAHSPLLSQQGDGIKAYLKLIFSLLDDDRSVVFIDEPEAFLHPPQRRQLGALVAKLAKDESKQVFISTHDSEFLRGALSATADIKVFNLKSDGNNHTAQSVGISDFKSLTQQQPEILNERILNSFFYEKTIITESETDRVFYEYASALYHWELFQNKNYVGMNGIDGALNLFEKLNELSLNVAVIVDIDFLTNRSYPSFLNDDQLRSLHNKFKQTFNGSSKYERVKLKKHGVSYLAEVDSTLSATLTDLINSYSKHGLFVVGAGEVESFTASSKNNLEDMINAITTTRKRNIARFTKQVLT